MEKIDLTKRKFKNFLFEMPLPGYGFKTIQCIEWKNGVRTEVYIDIKTNLSCEKFILKLLEGKNVSNIRIEVKSEVRRGLNKKEETIENFKKYLIPDTYIDPLDVNLEDVFPQNEKILIKNFNIENNEKLFYYLLESVNIKLSLVHKTIKLNELKTLGDNSKEIYNILKELSNLQKEIGQVKDFRTLVQTFFYENTACK